MRPPRALPPCAVMHGTDDQSVDVGQSRAFADALRQSGATVDDNLVASVGEAEPVDAREAGGERAVRHR